MDKRDSYLEDMVRYIKKNLKKGYTKESLKWALVSQGNSRREVEKALAKADIELAQEAPILHTKPQITHEIIEPKEYATKLKKSWWKNLFG